MKKYISLALLTLFSFFSCNNNNNNNKKRDIKEQFAECFKKIDASLSALTEDAEYALEQMKKTRDNKQQNNVWFDDFLQKKEQKFSEFCEMSSYNILSCYIDSLNYETDEEKEKIEDERNNLHEELLNKHHLRIEYYGGGSCQQIDYKENYLYNLFKDYITEDNLLYCQIKDKATFFRYRAMMGIDEELPEKMFLSDQFLKKYPKSNKFEEIKKNYLGDISYFISEAYGYETPKEEMRKIIKNYPKTFMSEIFSRYLKGEDFNQTNKIENLLDKELKKHDDLEFLFN